MPALKHVHDYGNIHEEQTSPEKKRYTTVPVKHESIHKNKNAGKAQLSKALKLNMVLMGVGGVLTLFFIAIYSVVAISETKLAGLHSKISELNYENIELENKLENVKSYYSVDTKVSANASFDKAKNVLEVNKVDAKKIDHIAKQSSNLNTVTGF